MTEPIHVLIVDDNEGYRQAFRRNLILQDFRVYEAENSDAAIQIIKSGPPDVLVTDLQMRTRTEGLDLIREARDIAPLMPIILISAVGTFEEGALASKLGAMHVVAKSKIEDEIKNLYELIDSANDERARNQVLLEEIEAIRGQSNDNGSRQDRIREILNLPEAGEYVKSEAFDTLLELGANELRQRSRASMEGADAGGANSGALSEVDEALASELDSYGDLAEDSRDSLRTAEYLYRQEEKVDGGIDFSRNIGFSYCFAVENETKSCMGRKFLRMLKDKRLYDTISQLLEGPSRHVGVFFHQALLHIQREHEMAFSIDNVRQVFHRILEHREKYKPDGLKAIAILIVCFGRTYEVRTARSKLKISNPLNIKGLDDENDILLLAQRLARLQHYRNPYIHPEISEMEKISAIRSETLACLGQVKKIV